jgi:hypothetical protein
VAEVAMSLNYGADLSGYVFRKVFHER